jgi:KDO2-lipid IV(A) lauroyltransferase
LAAGPSHFGKRLQYRLEAGVFGLFIIVSRMIGLRASSYLMGRLGRFIGPRLRLSRRAHDNLSYAMPELSPDERSSIVADMWENLGRVLGEYPHLQSFARRRDHFIEVIGYDRTVEIMVQHGSGICVAGHFANWELALLAPLADYSGALVYRSPNNPYIDAWLTRQRHMMRPLIPVSKSVHGARAMTNILKNGGYLCALLDQKLSGGIDVPFFGHPAATSPTISRLALHHRCPIVPVSVERRHGTYFTLTMHEAILPLTGPDRERNVYELTCQINQFFEKQIRARPAQWLWLHRRWGKNICETKAGGQEAG